MGAGNRCGLDMRALDGGSLDLQRADRAGLQLACAHGIDGELCAGNAAGCQLPGGDCASLQGIRHGAEGYGGILPRQAVVGILRHAHGYFHANAPCHNADAVAKEDVGERGILPVFLGVGQIDEINLERNGRKITASIVFGLHSLTHIRIALAFGFGFVALGHFAGLGYRHMNPLRVDVCADVRRINIKLRQIQDIAVRIFTRRHDASGNVGFVHIVGNTGQVLAFPYLHVGIRANALDKENVEPVTGQLRAVFIGQAALAQQGFNGIDILDQHIFGGGR